MPHIYVHGTMDGTYVVYPALVCPFSVVMSYNSSLLKSMVYITIVSPSCAHSVLVK